MWESLERIRILFFLLTILTLKKRENSTVHYSSPNLLGCALRIGHSIEDWIQRKNCRGSEGHLLFNTPEGQLIDWGPRGTPKIKGTNISSPWIYHNDTLSKYGNACLI